MPGAEAGDPGGEGAVHVSRAVCAGRGWRLHVEVGGLQN